ncbi:MAG: DUF4136 domain-containing protein [Acidobacteria bacterium]|nr:DUF4136 domain-containing protein [Acidobacteriota bacterium]
MRIVRALGVLALVLCASAGAASAQSVQSDFDRSFDFSKLRTFNFAAQRFDDALAHDSLNDGRVRHALETRLMASGFGMEELERPDFAVAYYVTSRNKFSVQDYGPPRWFGRRDVRVDEYTEGTLTVDLVDVRTGQLVWRGRVSGTVELKGNDKKIDKAVDKLVRQLLKDAKKGA